MCFCLPEPEVITVDEGSDVILPCSLSRQDITNKMFEWKKGGRQVFLYDDEDHSNIVNTGQDQQFKGRVEHFPDELKSGDASIIIKDTKVTDSGEYICEFPNLNPRQIFQMKLDVVAVEAPQPSVKILDQTKFSAELQCEVGGAFPKPELHWEDGAGNKLLARDPQVTERGRRYDIILKTTVTKTDIYRCVVTQKEINHQTHDDIHVHITGYTAGDIAGIFIAAVVGVVGLVFAVFIRMYRIISFFIKGKAKPSVRILKQTQRVAELQCEVRGAFPKPELHWQDSEGYRLPAPEPQVTKRGIRYDIILKTIVYNTDRYRCVATQKEINHQTHAYIYVHFTEPTIIIMEEGSDVILPCSLGSRQDITNKKFEWKKGGCLMFLYDNGPVNENNQTQDQQFKGRVSHFPDELKSGNASITIRDMKKADTGDYTCEFPDLQPSQIFHIKLVLEPTIIRVGEGRDATLPCSLSSRQDITSEKFVWKKDGRQVFLYDNGPVNDNSQTQDQQFKGRVKHFPDELKSGKTSITIRDMKKADTGDYTCEFTDLQPSQTFHIVLVLGEYFDKTLI
ncbi:hemicentin-1-like isoform X8 [Scomber scombrus]|uniref:Hemicentin-1-like isoform X8 n=1 Tax=Scomber scombrus TaxID=13677 RepID=A0AAV1Q544_SCOSC